MTPSPWWQAIGRAETLVECGANEHRIVWEAGELLAPDHDDIDAERALVALGGEACACAELLETWASHSADLRLLTYGPRGAADQIRTPQENPGPQPGTMLRPRARAMAAGSIRSYGPTAAVTSRQTMVAGPGRAGPPMPAPADDGAADTKRIIELLKLGDGIPRRLLAAVVAGYLAAPGVSEAARTQLHAALYGRALGAVTAWLGAAPGELDLAVIAEHEAPGIRRASADRLEARLPYGWLVDVWARGLEVFWDRLCLAATTADGRSWELVTVGPDLAEPGVIRVELPS